MSKKLYSLTVRGRKGEWGFRIKADPKHVADWREDGLDVEEIAYLVPAWIVDIGLFTPWCFFQDLFHFRNPFRP